ncbi:RidA family protein [Saccharopolyspora shandongensis]|uniref:RidA family protein n=1 Tax=Saccharopolyspora shandongensis TaxID=418495 RepID=UPI00340AA15D
MTPTERLAELGLVLPIPPDPLGSYVPATRVGELLFVAGHTARGPERPATAGIVGVDVPVEVAAEEAARAALNLLAAAERTVGLDSVGAVVSLRGYVRSRDDFTAHPRVVDGASELLGKVFPGQPHSRAAIGVSSLPGGACVELEAVLRVGKS